MRPRRRRIPPAPELDMSPMIDVTFLLLIFFMLTIRFRVLDRVLQTHLPKDVGANPAEHEPRERLHVELAVLEPGSRVTPRGDPWAGRGPWRYGADRRVVYRVGPLRTESLDAVRARIAANVAIDPELAVVIDPGEGAVAADAIGVLDAAVLAKCADVSFTAAR